MIPDLQAKLEMLCLGASKPLKHLTFGVELMGFWVARDIVQYQKNFKSLTGKVLPDFDGTNPEKGFLLSRPSCTTKRLAAGVYLFPSRLGGKQIYR